MWALQYSLSPLDDAILSRPPKDNTDSDHRRLHKISSTRAVVGTAQPLGNGYPSFCRGVKTDFTILSVDKKKLFNVTQYGIGRPPIKLFDSLISSFINTRKSLLNIAVNGAVGSYKVN